MVSEVLPTDASRETRALDPSGCTTLWFYLARALFARCGVGDGCLATGRRTGSSGLVKFGSRTAPLLMRREVDGGRV